MSSLGFRKIVVLASVCSLGIFSISVTAGQVESQRQMTQRLNQAKQKLQQAEAAKGEERQKLMDEHMKMMHENMKKMMAMKPKSSMSMQEHEDWINEHQKLMDQMMEQMMKENRMMMGAGSLPKDMEEMPKH